MKIGLPSGIGDCSWAISKLRHVGPFEFQIADGHPYRTKPYFDLLDCSLGADYGKFQYNDILLFEQATGINGTTTWRDLAGRDFDTLLLEPNRHLEMGRPLAEWLPDLPTDYHYPLHTTPEDQAKAAAFVAGLPRPLWGISAASYRGSEAWTTWGRAQWEVFLRGFHATAGGTFILMGGFWDDLTHSLGEVVHALVNADRVPAERQGWRRYVLPRPHPDRVIIPAERFDTVGKTTVGSMVEILKHLDGYIGFSSGMGILNTVLHGKTFMLWPEHQLPLSTSWADPAMLEDGTYQTSRWIDPAEVLVRARQWATMPSRPERAVHQR